MKRFLSLLLCLGLLTGPALAADSVRASLPDWAQGAYSRLEAAGALPYAIRDHGATAETVVTRGAFAQILVLSLKASVPASLLEAVPMVELDYFADPAPEYIMRAASWGILQGRIGDDGLRYGDLDKGLSRQEAAKMVCSALDFFTGLGYEIVPVGENAVYSDARDIAGWAAPYAGRVASYQLMVGDQFGSFHPWGELCWDSALVLGDRTLTLLKNAAAGLQAGEKTEPRGGVPLQSGLDWSQALHMPDYNESKPLTGYALGCYAIDNGDGTLSALVVPPTTFSYTTSHRVDIPPTELYVESYDAQGSVTASKTLPMELPIWGGFLDGGDCFYLAFGQENLEESDDKEVYRVVQYDREWNRVSAASVTGGESYTVLPYEATLSRMALSPDGGTLVLHAARVRYTNENGERHQSNITITVRTDGMRVKSVSGEYPDNHVSHSFGQFVQFDGDQMVTVDHGDAYPRSFVLQDGHRRTDLLNLNGPVGENRTYAIGSGFEVTDSGYLFLGCSAEQDGNAQADTPWNVFVAYTGKNGDSAVTFTWLTQKKTDIRCARLVKLSADRFMAMWGIGGDVHYQLLDGRGRPEGEEGILANTPMPTTQPVVSDGIIRWIGVYEGETSYGKPQPAQCALKP